MIDPHIVIAKSATGVYITIDGHEFKMSPAQAREAGEALFKTGCDVAEQEART